MNKHTPGTEPAQQPQPDWRGKVYDADTHQWVDAPQPDTHPAPAPEKE